MGSTIMMERLRSLYDYTVHGLKMEQLSEGIINLIRIDMLIIILVILIIDLIVLDLFLKMLVDMRDKIQALDNLIKTNHGYLDPDIGV